MKLSKPGVIYLMAHLLITLAVITVYLVIYLVTGESDQTLKMALVVIIGYWFGAMGKGTGPQLMTTDKGQQDEKKNKGA